MAKKPLTEDGEFVVGDEKILMWILVILFVLIALYGVADIFIFSGLKGNYTSLIYLVALVPAFLLVQRVRSNQIALIINRKGIYEGKKLVCDWAHLHKAYISQAEKKGFRMLIPTDDFILVVEYLKEGSDTGFRRKIPLTNTQNQSEEDIMAAIKYYGKLWAESH